MKQETTEIVSGGKTTSDSLVDCIEQLLVYEERVYQKKCIHYSANAEMDYSYFNVYYSGDNLDTIRIELIPDEEEGISLECSVLCGMPDCCNEEAVRKECERINYLFGDSVEFKFYEKERYNDASVSASKMLVIESDDICFDDLAEWALECAEKMAGIVDRTFMGLLYAALRSEVR